MRITVAVLVVALVLALAVPTAAVTGEADDAGALTLAPHDGPNGEYASVTDGEIEVAFDELNDEAVTTAHDVFTVTLEADCAAEVWVEVDGVTVYRGDDPADRLDGEDEAVVLQPGETIAVGLEIDTTGTAPDPDAMTVHAEETDDCGSASRSPTRASDGADLTATASVTDGSDHLEKVVTVTVRNDGTAAGIYKAEPTVDGAVVGSQAVAVPPGEVRELTFVHRFDRPGTYQVAVGDTSTAVEITEPSGAAPEFRVTALEPADARVQAGNATDVVATVENAGDAAGTYTAVLTDNGTIVAEQSVTVPAGETRQVTFTRAFDEPGAHELAVGERRATVIVESTGSPVRVVEASVADATLDPGNVTSITVTVENRGTTDDEVALDIRVADVVVETVTVTVPAGDSRTVTVDRRFDTPGVYPVTVDGVDAGEVVVRAGDSTAARLLGSSLSVVVLPPVLAGLLLAAWRRRMLRAMWR